MTEKLAFFDQKDKAPEDVRREFAFRFYDAGGEGYFEKKECAAHLKSYRLAAHRVIERQINLFCVQVARLAMLQFFTSNCVAVHL